MFMILSPRQEVIAAVTAHKAVAAQKAPPAPKAAETQKSAKE
jgi:hypothetical protein